MSAICLTLCAKKGGVGKTSLAVNIAGYLSGELECRVLLIDTDSQASLSQFFMKPEKVDALRREETIAAVFDERCEINPGNMIHKTDIAGLYLVPASDYLADFNLPRPTEQGEKQKAIQRFVREVEDKFTFIIFDTPPHLDTLPTWASLIASDFVLTPIVPELFSAQSIAGVDRVLSTAREQNPRLHFLGYVVNMKQKRRSLHIVNEEKLRAIHGDRVLDHGITNLTGFAEAQAKRIPITAYDKAGDAATITKDLAREVVARIQKQISRGTKQTKPASRKEAA